MDRFIQILDSKATKREKDANGFLIIKDNPIAKAGVFEYLENEILPNSKSDKLVKVYRPFDSLVATKESFANKPIKYNHRWVGDTEPTADGAIGSNITADDKSLMLKADLIIYNPTLIQAIENGECVELSPAYTGEVKKAQGRFNGSDYDYIQSVECVNHLAVVKNGRSGNDLRILDSKNKELKMAQKIDFLNRVLKFLDSAEGDNEPKVADGEPTEPKVEDSSDFKNALSEILKGEGEAVEKLAKIGELLGTLDNEPTPEPTEPKVTDSEDDEDDEGESKVTDGEDDELKAKDFADSMQKVIDKIVESRIAQYKNSVKADLVKVQDSYERVSKALGTSFDKSGMSADDIFKFGYETLSGLQLSKGENAETAFNVIAKSKKVVFKDNAPAFKAEDSNILKMLDKISQ